MSNQLENATITALMDYWTLAVKTGHYLSFIPIALKVAMGIALDRAKYHSLCMIESRIFNGKRYINHEFLSVGHAPFLSCAEQINVTHNWLSASHS